MTPRVIIQTSDPFEATLVSAGLYNHMSQRQSVIPPVHTGHQVPHCSFREFVTEAIEGKEPITRVRKCFNPTFSKSPARHGFLCKMHHDLDYLNQVKVTKRTIERDENQLMETMSREVIAAITDSKNPPALNYVSYRQWGWAYKPDVEEQEFDEDFE